MNAEKQIPRQQFLIPNNLLGRIFLWALRRYLNQQRYAVRLRGRTPRQPMGRFTRDVPRSQARRLGVYLNDKHPLMSWEIAARNRCIEDLRRQVERLSGQVNMLMGDLEAANRELAASSHRAESAELLIAETKSTLARAFQFQH